MYENYKIAVVIPAYNEEILIKDTILSIPHNIVDKIIVIDDASKDNTLNILKEINLDNLIVLKHKKNRGVGASIITGYKYCIENDIDYSVVMAGDAQMDPRELLPMLQYIIYNNVDYVKGNRFLKPWTLTSMPVIRLLGSLALNLMTKVATGYYHIGDPQSGYTIISLKTLQKIPLNDIFPRYGYPNDILGKLSSIDAKVRDFPISAIYKNEKSGLKPIKIIVPYTKLLLSIYKQRRSR